MLRTALIAAMLAWCGVASADSRRNFHASETSPDPIEVRTTHFNGTPNASSKENAADVVDQAIAFAAGSFQTYQTPRHYKTVYIGASEVLDVTAQSDRVVILRGLKPGASDVLFLAEDDVTVSKIRVIVNDGGPSRIRLYDKALLTGYTAYRCWDGGCEYVDEIISKEVVPVQTHTIERQTVIYGR